MDVVLRKIAALVSPPINRRDQHIEREAQAEREDDFGQAGDWLIEAKDAIEEFLDFLEHESGRCLGPEIGPGEKQKMLGLP